MPIKQATGATITPKALLQEKYFDITAYGASPVADATTNTAAINNAIKEASREGGTVFIPAGEFQVYTIILKSNVNLFLTNGSIIKAAKPDSSYSSNVGNYAQPEVNLYAGLQDHGHSYFANSLIYGVDLENISICGHGLITGGDFDQTSLELNYTLQGDDPEEPLLRTSDGHTGSWLGNKGIALVRCKNVILEDFALTIGGHFAIIAEGVTNLYVNHILIDTTRDAFDIDCCQDVTVLHSTFNSLTDDGLCLKASYGAGIFMPTRNVLIEDCIVSGYDAGSVYAGEYTQNKLVAEDACGPTGRVKFGTESTCGYELVTIRRVHFERSRGFAIEAVDGSGASDILFTDCTMENISSSPIFIRAGERARFPVTGLQKTDELVARQPNVRLSNTNWVLPASSIYQSYQAKRYTPQYNRTRQVSVDGQSAFSILEDSQPVLCNPANYAYIDGHYYLKVYNTATQTYEPDLNKLIEEKDLPLYANAVGSKELPLVCNIEISHLTITNADPRYPVLLMGLTDSPLQNIRLHDIHVEYRGGLSMEHAVEQRQLYTSWSYSQFHAPLRTQTLPWLVNPFFLKNEGLLPRADWNEEFHCFVDDPYNVPELPDVYPEPSNWGILPAYGLYARHVEGLELENITFTYKLPDTRHVCVLDDARQIAIHNLKADCATDISPVAAVTHFYRRHTNEENVPERPYFTTTVTDLHINKLNTPSTCPETASIQIHAPAPGTPADSSYPYPTVPIPENGYSYSVATDSYPLPRTVYRPFIDSLTRKSFHVGEEINIELKICNPAGDIPVTVSCLSLPDGATFDSDTRTMHWAPDKNHAGSHTLIFTLNDGLLCDTATLRLHILA